MADREFCKSSEFLAKANCVAISSKMKAKCGRPKRESKVPVLTFDDCSGDRLASKAAFVGNDSGVAHRGGCETPSVVVWLVNRTLEADDAPNEIVFEEFAVSHVDMNAEFGRAEMYLSVTPDKVFQTIERV